MFVNNCSEEQEKSITSYVTEFTQKFKSIEKIDKSELRINSIKKNVGLTLVIWLAGTTIIGMPVVLAIILFRGFCMGYTISAITYTIGTGKSFLFCFLFSLKKTLSLVSFHLFAFFLYSFSSFASEMISSSSFDEKNFPSVNLLTKSGTISRILVRPS